MATLLKASLLLALLLPPVLVGAAAWGWWPTLGRPWVFVASGLSVLYAFAGYLITRQFGDIGISGQPGTSVDSRHLALHALQRHALRMLLLFLAVAVVALWLLRQFLSS